MITCVVITKDEMQSSAQILASNNVLGDVTVFQNSQLIAKSKTRFLDRNVLCIECQFLPHRGVVRWKAK